MLEDDTSGSLYESSELSVNKTLAILFTWFCSSPSISKEAFSGLLNLLHNFVLPKDNKLPSSYPQARSVIHNVLVPVEEYHCCINDCIIFRNGSEGSFESLTRCPQCDDGGEHADNVTCISDLHQTHTWKSVYSSDGPFTGDPRGICLSLCTDGTNPFSKEKKSYSMWPITLTMLNLPFHVRILSKSILLAGIIPGKSEPQSIDPYVEILVDEIIRLNGMKCYDAYKDEEFHLKVGILMHVLDYPGHNKLFHCHGEYLHR